jgi:uncharacterized protein YndB with AHSA1/START domain
VKYKLELIITKPRIEVWQAFVNTENTNKWQPMLKEIESVEGTPGQPGAVSKLTYEEGKVEYTLTEKIISREDPICFESIFENKFTDNIIKNTFVEQDDDKTLWVLEAKYTFKTMAMRIIGPLRKKNFISRTQKEMERFKELTENL